MVDEKLAQTAAIVPSNFQVYAKIEEESRKDNSLLASFLLTLNDAKGSVTYEFRGVCNIVGTWADFESMMEVHKGSRVPKILDLIYQRLYPQIFLLAGMTTASYPQSIGVSTEMVLTEPIPVHQEALPEQKEKPKLGEKPANPVEKVAEAPQVTMVKAQQKTSVKDIDSGSNKPTAAK
ncbi:MAG: hypothetical protein HMLIMOIP_002287 [Candidatus Nitrosomirales archaeon]|jgi:hypothetical protein